MKKCLGVLAQPTPSAASEAELASDQQEREGALELLADLCENMDNAAGARGVPSAPTSPSTASSQGDHAPAFPCPGLGTPPDPMGGYFLSVFMVTPQSKNERGAPGREGVWAMDRGELQEGLSAGPSKEGPEHIWVGGEAVLCGGLVICGLDLFRMVMQ